MPNSTTCESTARDHSFTGSLTITQGCHFVLPSWLHFSVVISQWYRTFSGFIDLVCWVVSIAGIFLLMQAAPVKIELSDINNSIQNYQSDDCSARLTLYCPVYDTSKYREPFLHTWTKRSIHHAAVTWVSSWSNQSSRFCDTPQCVLRESLCLSHSLLTKSWSPSTDDR